MNDVVDIEKDDITQAANNLLRAVKDNPIQQWMFNTEKNLTDILLHFNISCVKYCMKYGKAWKTTNLETVLLVKNSDIQDTLWRNFRSGMLKMFFMVNKTSQKRLLWFNERVAEERKKIMSDKKYWHVWIMATDPDKIGQGFGHIALNHIIKVAQADKLPLYLQTDNAKAINFYLAHEFKICSEFSVDNTFSITTLARGL